jgi:site-specific recombinase XerD
VVWEWWYKAAKQAEIDINLYQATKHSLGMRYVMMDGARLDILQALFGHADIRTTQKYARFLTQETTDVFRALVTVSSPLQITDK